MTSPYDLDLLRAKLASRKGRAFWRSFEELADTEEFREYLDHEFPAEADLWTEAGPSRRRFLQLMSASFALAGLSACGVRQPAEKIVPYIDQPDGFTPGQPLFYATALPWRGHGTGVLVESHLGRPTKIEGNDLHPASLGGTDAITQAAILDLYDPERMQAVSYRGGISTWEAFVNALYPQLGEQKISRGAGLRILTGTVTSPTLVEQLRSVLAAFPEARWHRWEAACRDNVRAGARLAFGTDVSVSPRLDRASIVVSLDDDFLSSGLAPARVARDFASRRRVADGVNGLNRLYAAESSPGLAGACADHRLPARAGSVDSLARALASKVGIEFSAGAALSPLAAAWVSAAANDLRAHRARGVVLIGEEQPAAVHAIGHAINGALGNLGSTVVVTDPVEEAPILQADSIAELCGDMEAGKVDLLVILEGNPVFDAPADLRFAEKLKKVRTVVRLSASADETAEWSHWNIPAAHPLESWTDLRAFDGTVSIAQPLIAPLWNGKSAHELLSLLLGASERNAHDIVKDHWRRQHTSGFDEFWRQSLHDGVVGGTASPERGIAVRESLSASLPTPPESRETIELNFRPDPAIWDGRYANNGWLQELPRPMTKLTWDNAAVMSPGTAASRGISNEQIVRLTLAGRSVEAPAWIIPGLPDETVTVHYGNGRQRVGKVGTGAGFDAYRLRASAALGFASGASIVPTPGRLALATTQHHNSMEGRALVRATSVAEFVASPDVIARMGEDPPKSLSLYPPVASAGYAWGMTIDLNTCIGCNACVVACQSENNIPVVGKDQVMKGREMQWIRIDRYFEGGLENPRIYHEPVLCMHCENAPCEVVCPVGATVHSTEGLNEMVYNRCVGTRYCSNNCPYKVRRFNFLQYSDVNVPTYKLMHNPNVTVRTRGVMEKCSYCIQRISMARIESEKADRRLRDGEIRTACEQACPARAIVFGDINDRESRVARAKAGPLNYGLLTDLNTRPRTTYLAKVWNPNPEIAEEKTNG